MARWVLDGRVVSSDTGAATVATADDVAARILRFEHAAEALVAAIRDSRAQPAADAEAEEEEALLIPFSLASAPAAVAAALRLLVKDGSLQAQLSALEPLPPFAALCDEALGDEEQARAQAGGGMLVAIKPVRRPDLRCAACMLSQCVAAARSHRMHRCAGVQVNAEYPHYLQTPWPRLLMRVTGAHAAHRCSCIAPAKCLIVLRFTALTSLFRLRTDASETFGQLKQRICAALGVPPAKTSAVTLWQSAEPSRRRAEPDAGAAVMAALAGTHWSDGAPLYVHLARAGNDEEESAGADDLAYAYADVYDRARAATDWRAALPPPALTAVHRVRCAS